MFINSVSLHHVKIQHQKLYSKRKNTPSFLEKIQWGRPNPSLLERKVAYTQFKLLELSKNHELFTQLVIIHCLFFDKVARPYPHTIDINNNLDSAKGIAQSNLFKQKYFKSIPSFESLENELINGEEGIFSIKCPGLSMTIIKLLAPNQDQVTEQKFIVIQSLEKFTKRKNFLYGSDSFTRNILDSLRTLLHNKGVWTDQECIAYYKLTGINSSHLIGCSFSNDFSPLSKFGRTSDIAIPEEVSMILDDVNEKFQLPKSLLTNKE